MIFDTRTQQTRKKINQPSADHNNLFLCVLQILRFFKSGSDCLNINISITLFWNFFIRLIIYNRLSVFSVAVKKARFVCEDGSYMEEMGNNYDGGFTHTWSIDYSAQLFISDYRIYTSEILTRVEPSIQNWGWDKPQNRGLYSCLASKVRGQFIALRDWNSSKFQIMRLLKQNVVTFRLYRNNFSVRRCNVLARKNCKIYRI